MKLCLYKVTKLDACIRPLSQIRSHLNFKKNRVHLHLALRVHAKLLTRKILTDSYIHGHRSVFYARGAHHLIFSLFKKVKIIRITLAKIFYFYIKFAQVYPFSCGIVHAAFS